MIKQQSIYANENLSKEKKIQTEKRRRNQIYQTLDYVLSIVTYFDFFSFDSFQIINRAKEFSIFYNVQLITNEFLLLSFIYSNTQMTKLLEEYGITKENILKELPFITKKNQSSKNPFIEKIQQYIGSPKKEIDNKFSHEINLLIEKASENALIRFKTPVITSEILFLTLIEQKNNKLVKLLKKIVVNDLNWHLLRYKLIKRMASKISPIICKSSALRFFFFIFFIFLIIFLFVLGQNLAGTFLLKHPLENRGGWSGAQRWWTR
jgi:hypothetical protein